MTRAERHFRRISGAAQILMPGHCAGGGSFGQGSRGAMDV